MRAVVLRGPSIAIEEVPDPVPETGQILVAPLAVGICGSDLHARQMLAELAAAAPDAVFPLVPGHEIAGTVVAAGPGSETELRPGDVVTGLPFTPALQGSEAIGLSPTRTGGLAALTRLDAVRTFPVPGELDVRLAALAEPVAVGVHAFARAAAQGPVVVVGAGPIGLAIIAVAGLSGRHPVIAVEPSASRRAMALRLGADSASPPGVPLAGLLAEMGYQPSPISPLLEHDPTVATIFECVGRPSLVQSLLAEAPAHSRVVLAGACSHAVEVTPLQLTTSEVTVTTSFAYRPQEFRRALGLIADSPELFGQLITSDRPLSATPQAFDDLAGDPDEVKILIHPQDL